VLRAKERTPTLCHLIVFTFGLAFDSIKEFEGVSYIILKTLVSFRGFIEDYIFGW
jgi:hypothetical protein